MSNARRALVEIEFNEDDEEVLDITAGDLSLDDLIDR
jgi:hypothetical protein